MSGLVFGFILLVVIAAAGYIKLKDIKAKELLITENQILRTKVSAATTIRYDQAIEMGRDIIGAVNKEELANNLLWGRLGLKNEVDAGWKAQLKTWADRDRRNRESIQESKATIERMQNKIKNADDDLALIDRNRKEEIEIVDFFISSDE